MTLFSTILRLPTVLFLTSLAAISPSWGQEDDPTLETTAKLAHKRVAETAADFAIKVDSTTTRFRTWMAESGVELRTRFMVHPRRRRALIDALNRDAMKAFAAAEDVEFAYNTLRVIPTPQSSSDTTV